MTTAADAGRNGPIEGGHATTTTNELPGDGYDGAGNLTSTVDARA